MKPKIFFINLFLLVFCCFVTESLFAQVSVHINPDADVSATEADVTITGDWTCAGTVNLENSRIWFTGSEDQFLNQSVDGSIPHLVIDKAAGAVYLTDTLRIMDSLSLRQGNLVAADTALLLLLSTALCNGDSTSFVDGPCAKVYGVSAVADSFIFPTGKNPDFRPVVVFCETVGSDSIIISVEQFNRSAEGLSPVTNSLDKVSKVHYWHIGKEGPGTFTGAHLTFSYDTLVTGDGVEIGSELRVAYLDTNDVWTWYDWGGEGTEDYVGTIRSDAISDFGSGYFTFADAQGGGDLSLPVLLSLFDVADQRGAVSIIWKSESEINNAYWLVQRKEENDSTAVDYETIARLDGQGTKSSVTLYSFVDCKATIGKTYAYRLADVSVSGRKHYHDPLSIVVGVPNKYQLYQNFPNPFNPLTHILYDLPHPADVIVEVYSVTGQKIARLVDEHQKPGYYKLSWNGKNLNGNQVASGVYILRIQASGVKDGKTQHFAQVKKMVLVR